MSSPPDAPDPRERIEDYLDHLYAPLVGRLPYRERVSLRAEVGEHLTWLVGDLQKKGLDEEEATERALAEFGEPGRVAQEYLYEWSQGAPEPAAGAPTRAGAVRAAAVRAFAAFGPVTVINLFAVQGYAEASYYHPEYLPYLAGLMGLSPLVAGCIAGASASAHLSAGVRYAVLILAACSLVVGAAMLPYVEGLGFALLQLLFWLPAGEIAALGTASLVRSHRYQRFWRSTQGSAR